MCRHDLRFVLQFGAQAEFAELAQQLHDEESARGWTTPRIWCAVSGPVNLFHADPGGVGDVLAAVAQLSVPGTALQCELAGVSLRPGGRSSSAAR